MAQAKKKKAPARSGAANKKKINKSGRKTGGAKTTVRKEPAKAVSSDARGPGGEAVFFLVFAVCILLFLGDLGAAGMLGRGLKLVQTGLFGTLGYVFPFYLLWFCCFGYANGRRLPWVTAGKLLASFLTWVSVCGLAELLSGRSLTGDRTLPQCFAEGAEGFGGGWFGGLFNLKLYPVFGVMGTYVVLIAAILIGLVLTSGKSLLRPLEESSGRVMERAKADSARRQESRALRREEAAVRREERAAADLEERRKKLEQRRSALKAKSLAFGEDTKITEEEDRTDASSRSRQERQKGSFEEAVLADRDEESPAAIFSGTIHGGENIPEFMPQKETRTLSELEQLDEMQREPNDPDEMSADELNAYFHREDRRRKRKKKTDAAEKESGEAHMEIHPAAGPGQEVPEDLILEEEPAVYVHPAEAEFSAEESLSAYDEFPDSPVPDSSAWEFPLPGEKKGKTQKKSSPSPEESIWRKGEKKDGNSGVSFMSPAAPETARKPEAPVVKREYIFPPMSILKIGPKKSGMSASQLKQTAVKLQQTLRNFGVGVTVTDISCGPTVTRYELQPDQGVKVSRIVGLADDIKLNLAAADIRIEAPIPGKAAVGIEVPNEENQTVYLKELLDSDEFRRFPSKVGFAVGRDIGGKIMLADLARMPHLLIAGATGSGKSVCINTIIMSILYKAHPDDVKLILIDPKVVELSVYNGIPHLLIPVVTDAKKATGALNWAVAEMSDRYQKFAELNVRNISGYNKHMEEAGVPDQKLPQIVVIVDEMADLMMVAASEVEEAVCRLAQLARAAGIHLVLATQRPSVNVITGLIKANVPSRIAFAVASYVDSRTIIDMNGAEKLLGKGDMLFYPYGYSKPVRVQGAFVTDEEVAEVVEFLQAQNDGPQETNASLAQHMEAKASEGAAAPSNERDELFVRAGRFIIEKDKASIGNLQRAFRIGFNRAARIMDQLADAGVVGPDEGTKARQILMTKEQFEEMIQGLQQ